MYYVNRNAFILKHKKPFIEWINSVTPENQLSEDIINGDCTILLIPVYIAEEDAIASIEENFEMIFRSELGNWYTSEDVWPKDITLEKFREWIEIEYHSVVVDVLKDKIKKEPY